MANLKRFPNPGSNMDMFIEIFKRTYPILCKKEYFSLYDLELAMIKEHLVSSEGFTGMKAFALSLREDSSRDPIYNQAKMYAELYRMLGWFSSSPEKNLIFTITELGKIIATSDVDNKVIFKECLFGIADENLIIEKKDGLAMRPFKYFLNVIRALDNKICKLELIYGPYRFSDDNILSAVKEIKDVRGKTKLLFNNIEEFGIRNKIAKNTMENYTRFPIAVLDYLDWVVKEKSNLLYPGSKNMVIMKLTLIGIKDSEQYNKLRDIRIDDYVKMSDDLKRALIYVSFYDQLKRIGIDYNFDLNLVDKYRKCLKEYFNDDRELLFSPYQMIPELEVNKVLNIVKEFETDEKPIEKNDLLDSVENYEKITEQYITEIKFKTIFSEITDEHKKLNIYKEIYELKNKPEKEIVYIIMEKYKNANKEVFYPLIGDIFNILGFNCVVSRNGTNYERYDAIIIDEENSIPIEIKSPGEEINISVKAVRQAIENKIILLSRKTFPTNTNTSSFVVGYKLPNERAEVITLVDDIEKTFNYNIGILDFESLLKILINRIIYNKVIIGEELFELKGTVSINEED